MFLYYMKAEENDFPAMCPAENESTCCLLTFFKTTSRLERTYLHTTKFVKVAGFVPWEPNRISQRIQNITICLLGFLTMLCFTSLIIQNVRKESL